MYDGNLWKPISEYSEGECIYFIDGTYKKIEKIKRSERFKTKKKSLLSRIIETFKFK